MLCLFTEEQERDNNVKKQNKKTKCRDHFLQVPPPLSYSLQGLEHDDAVSPDDL